MALIDQPTSAPTRKVSFAALAATFGAFLAPIILAQFPALGMFTNASMLETAIASLLTGAATFAGGWLPRERE